MQLVENNGSVNLIAAESMERSNSKQYLLEENRPEAEKDTKDRKCSFLPKRGDDPEEYVRKLILISTIIAVALGILVGYVISINHVGEPWMKLIGFPGTLFLRMLKAIIVPMMFSALVCGMSGLGSVGGSRVAKLALTWYFTTTILACSEGLLWANVFRPWRGFEGVIVAPVPDDSESSLSLPNSPLDNILELLKLFFTDNLFKAAYDMNMLGVIMFAVVLGLVLSKMGEQGKPLLDVIQALNVAVQKIINIIIIVSPLGVFSLISYNIGISGDLSAVIESVGLLFAARMIGVFIHGALVLPAIFFIATRKNIYPILGKVSQIWVVAFATSSSAATLPVTIQNVETNLNVDAPTAQFVCTTGCSINMDAAGILYSITAITMAKACGMDINFADMIVIVIVSTIISVGVAAIPSPGIINVMAVMSAIGIPLDKAVPLLIPLLSVDWLEDRLDTIVNIEGDVIGAVTVHHFLSGRRSD